MITHDKIISMKLPSNLLRLLDEKIKEHRINRSTFLRSLVLMALREEIVEITRRFATRGCSKSRISQLTPPRE